MKVKHAVITSVDRDELKDGGSIIWYNTIKAVKALNPDTTLETLIPDFKGQAENIQRIIDAAPEVVSHNIETVERLNTPGAHSGKIPAQYGSFTSVERRRHAHQNRHYAGLGRNKEEVIQTLEDLAAANVDVITLGQYLQPTKKHLPVHRFVHPDEFAELREIGYGLGFDYVESGPLVRSSYHSEKHVIAGYGRNKWLEEKATIVS